MKVAAITMVFNEQHFLPIWLDWYGSQLGLENLFIIDDGSDDGSTADPRIVHPIRKSRDVLDEDDRAALISFFHEALLKHYDLVIYTDVDEIIVPDPELGLTLKDYVATHCKQYLNPIGVHLIQNTHSEGPLDWRRPLLEQRHYVQFDPSYCKQVISRVPMRWRAGFHFWTVAPIFAPDLLLIHLRAMDRDVALSRFRNLRRVKFSSNALAKSHGEQFRLDEAGYLALLFSLSENECAQAEMGIDFSDQIRALAEPNFDYSKFRGRVARLPDGFSQLIRLNIDTSKWDEQTAAPDALSQSDIDALYQSAIEQMCRSNPFRSRNEPCPCGSGKRYKHCHGAIR